MTQTQNINRILLCATVAMSSSLWAAYAPQTSESNALIQADTRAQREEIERQFANAPGQAGTSVPTDKYPTKLPELPELETEKPFLWDVGGWVRSTFTTFDTQVGVDRNLRDYDGRFYLNLEYKRYHKFYGRVRTFFTDYNSGDSPTAKDENWQQFRFDQVFYQGDLARQLGWVPEMDLNLTAGRQFFHLGKGMALMNVLDGINLEHRNRDRSYKLVVARTIRYTPDIDGTLPVTRSESDRLFIGFRAETYEFLSRRFYALALAQIDSNDRNTATQNYDYDSYYVAVGGDGGIPVSGLQPNELSYSAEFMLEFGKGGATGTTVKEDIFAYGLMADLVWLPGNRFPFTSKGVFSYYFGSGDPDRGAQLGTVGGNRAGTDDSALNYFGYVNTGYSLAPRLTNLHMLRANYEAVLLERAKLGGQTVAKTLRAGSAYYAFFKNHSGVTMSDFTSVEDSSYVGSELDLYVDWAIVSDLSASFRYGAFFPGSAFSKHDVRNFFSASATLSF